MTSDNIAAKVQIAKILIFENGAVTQKSKGQKESVLETAVNNMIYENNEKIDKKMIELLVLLFKCGSDPNNCNEGEDSLLILALRNGVLDVAATLLRAGADINHKGVLHRTALIVWLKTSTGMLTYIFFRNTRFSICPSGVFFCNFGLIPDPRGAGFWCGFEMYYLVILLVLIIKLSFLPTLAFFLFIIWFVARPFQVEGSGIDMF